MTLAIGLQELPSDKSEPTEKSEVCGDKLAVRRADNRVVNSLPLHTPQNYTPYFNLEFHSSVQNYCRNHYQVNDAIKHNKGTTNDNDRHFKNSNFAAQVLVWNKKKAAVGSTNSSTTTQTFDPFSAPGSKIVRTCKVVVCGDVAVGKTCLVNRFGGQQQHLSSTLRSHQTTIGVDFDLQRFTVLGQPYVLQIWDTAGLERFRCITSSYYRGCQAALIVFDMSNLNSLASVIKWRDEVHNSYKTFEQLMSADDCALKAGTEPCIKMRPDAAALRGDADEKPLLFLVGTKSDLSMTEASRAFVHEQANRIAALMQAELWFVSAQTGDNVERLFERIAALSFNRAIFKEVQRINFEASTMGACLKEKILQHQRELWSQSSKLIKITRRREGDEKRSRCINIQCVIK